MNKHIELVKKWLDDPESVTQEELEANAESARKSDAADASAETAILAAGLAAAVPAEAARAAYAAERATVEGAAFWVKRHEELIDE